MKSMTLAAFSVFFLSSVAMGGLSDQMEREEELQGKIEATAAKIRVTALSKRISGHSGKMLPFDVSVLKAVVTNELPPKNISLQNVWEIELDSPLQKCFETQKKEFLKMIRDPNNTASLKELGVERYLLEVLDNSKGLYHRSRAKSGIGISYKNTLNVLAVLTNSKDPKKACDVVLLTESYDPILTLRDENRAAQARQKAKDRKTAEELKRANEYMKSYEGGEGGPYGDAALNPEP